MSDLEVWQFGGGEAGGEGVEGGGGMLREQQLSVQLTNEKRRS